MIGTDRWLERWLPLVRERAAGARVLEIGCGHGDDTAVLAGAGLAVTAFDLSPVAVAATRLRVPAAAVARRDLREPLPLPPGAAGVVVASLSLHYFPWAETEAIVARVREALRPGGLLLCRLNSSEDRHFGASGHREIEPGLYDVDGTPKRFFDRDSVERLFASGWHRRSLEHRTTRKYARTKALWEAVLDRSSLPGEPA